MAAAALAFVERATLEDNNEPGLDDDRAEKSIDADEDATTQAASALGAAGADQGDLRAELASVDVMLAIAERNAARPDARVRWLTDWIKADLLAGKNWNRRHLIIFTEYGDAGARPRIHLPRSRAEMWRQPCGSDRLCCTNGVRDSSCESSVVAGLHEQTHISRLQEQELAGLQ